MDESELLIQSPQLLLPEITDPNFLNNICAPFYGDYISNENFTVEFARNVIVPKAREHILSRDPATLKQVPTLVKLLIDNLHEDGLNLVTKEIFTSFEPLISHSNFSKRVTIVDTICETISHVSSRYRDKILIEMISIYSSKVESNFRILAAHLIPLVKKSQRVLNQFTALSLDRVIQVRQAVAKCLKDYIFDNQILKRTLFSLLKDQSLLVQRAAAANFGYIAPECINEYISLITNSDLAKAALKSMKAMVIANGFTPFYDAFQITMNYQPETSVVIVLNISRVVKKDELNMLFECAYKLRNSVALIQHLKKFSLVFEDKSCFLQILDPHDLKEWRERFFLIEQIIEFIEIFGNKLVNYAKELSKDPIAIVRSESVKLWAKLIEYDFSNAMEAKTLTETFQQRLVLCKIIGKCGVKPYFQDVVESLSKDPISNVRLCLANVLQGTEYFDQYFADSKDIEIELNHI